MKSLKTQAALHGPLFQHNNLNYYNLKKRIKKNEGFSQKPYRDKLGFLTIGYGHLVLSHEKHLINTKKTKQQLEEIFEDDFKRAVEDFNNHLNPYSFNQKDKELMIEMVFQIGILGVLKFKKLLTNLKKKHRYLVCFEMMNSLWYKQTPNRVKKLIKEFIKND